MASGRKTGASTNENREAAPTQTVSAVGAIMMPVTRMITASQHPNSLALRDFPESPGPPDGDQQHSIVGRARRGGGETEMTTVTSEAARDMAFFGRNLK